MLNNFIYAKTKDLFLQELNAGNILDEAIVFIENTKEIWNRGHYFGTNEIDPELISNLQVDVTNLKNNIVTKQETLVSGTNIKTINGESVLGEGNIPITAQSVGALPIGGGSITNGGSIKLSMYDTRDLIITGNNITADMSKDPGTWAGSFASVIDPVGDNTTMLGWYGGTEGLQHFYLGGDYLNPAVAINKQSEVSFLKKPTVSGKSLITEDDITTEANVKAVDIVDTVEDVNIEYATKEYVDTQIGDINGVLESIING